MATMPAAAHLSPDQLAELRADLEAKRADLQKNVARHGRPDPDAEEKPIEDMDLAEREIEENDAVAFAERELKILDEVQAALARLDAGSYGVSEATGDPIPFARLKAVPWARGNSDEA